MPLAYPKYDLRRREIPSRSFSSEFVTKAMARLVKPVDSDDTEQFPADLTVKCGSLDVEAHSHVLCQDSSYFKIICKGDFLEKYTQELNLPAEEEFLIRRLLCYCYTTGYNDEPYDDENGPPPHTQAPPYVNQLCLNAQMYGIADKYDIPNLKEKAAKKFDAALRKLNEQEKRHPHTGVSLVNELIEAIPDIYSSTPDGERRLRNRAVEVVICKWIEIRDHPGLQDLVAVVPEFFEERGIKFSGLRRDQLAVLD